MMMAEAKKRNVRVLVAEDNEDHLFLTVRALRDHNDGVSIEVDAVTDGEEALDFVYRRGRFEDRPRPHLILLDVKMPKVTGLEVLEQLKRDPDLRSIPVIMLTSSDRPEDIEMAYRLGTNSYVTKQGGLNLADGVADLAEYWTERSALPDPPD